MNVHFVAEVLREGQPSLPGAICDVDDGTLVGTMKCEGAQLADGRYELRLQDEPNRSAWGSVLNNIAASQGRWHIYHLTMDKLP